MHSVQQGMLVVLYNSVFTFLGSKHECWNSIAVPEEKGFINSNEAYIS
jgi:hypothetical protein